MSIAKWTLFEHFERVSFTGMTPEAITKEVKSIYYQAKKQYADLDVRMPETYIIDNSVMEACKVVDDSINDLWILAADETRSATQRKISITKIDTIGKEYEQKVLEVLRLTDVNAVLTLNTRWR